MSILPRAFYEEIDRRYRTDAPWPGEPESRWVTVLRVHCYEECFKEPRRGLVRAFWDAAECWLWRSARSTTAHG